jgi:hypothetical protein
MSQKPPRRYKVEVQDSAGQTIERRKFRDPAKAMNFVAERCAAGFAAKFTDTQKMPRDPRREETPRRPHGEKYRNRRVARSSYPPTVA